MAWSGPESGRTASPGSILLGVGPLSLPQFLERPQIVTRTSANRLELAEFHRWGGDLGEDILRVLVEDLSVLLAPDGVVGYPWDNRLDLRYQLIMKFARFDGQLGGDLVLSVSWALLDNATGKAVSLKNTEIREAASAADYESMAVAQSRALERLSREMAGEMQRLSGAPGG